MMMLKQAGTVGPFRRLFGAKWFVAAGSAALVIQAGARVRAAPVGVEYRIKPPTAARAKRPVKPPEARAREPRVPLTRLGRPGPPPPLWQRMTDNERDAIVAFTQEYFPGMFLELQRLRERSPERFRARMTRIAPEMRRMMEILEVNPERGALMIQERRLDLKIRREVAKYRSSKGSPDKRKELRKTIRRLCEEAFDAGHRRRELEIRALEARLDELKQRHVQAAQMRGELINQQLRQLLARPGSPKKKE